MNTLHIVVGLVILLDSNSVWIEGGFRLTQIGECQHQPHSCPPAGGPSGRQVRQARHGGRFGATRGGYCNQSEGCCEGTQWVSGLRSPLPLRRGLKELVAQADLCLTSPHQNVPALHLENLTLKHGIQYREKIRDPGHRRMEGASLKE